MLLPTLSFFVKAEHIALEVLMVVLRFSAYSVIQEPSSRRQEGPHLGSADFSELSLNDGRTVARVKVDSPQRFS